MLIICPECELNVSDKASSCPHCGYPMKQNITEPKRQKKANKRKRLPNGFGQITEIKGRNLRKPFRVMIPAGKTPEGKPISKLLQPNAYFETYNDAYAALMEYSKNPFDLDRNITMQELYDKWSERHFKEYKNPSGIRTIKAAWNYCSSIYNMSVREVRARHLKNCVEEGEYTNAKGITKKIPPATSKKAKILFNMLYNYALEYEYVDRNYATSFQISKRVLDTMRIEEKHHISFTDEEMKKLWNNVDRIQFVDAILIQCYSGWRPNELISLTLNDVDLRNRTMIGGSKTEAGTNRIVPIHDKIYELVVKRCSDAIDNNRTNIFLHRHVKSGNIYPATYKSYRRQFIKVIDSLGLNSEHRPHDPRKQFVTMAKRSRMDEYAIKYIIGHTIPDLTENVYTERSIEWLKEEMQKIT